MVEFESKNEIVNAICEIYNYKKDIVPFKVEDGRVVRCSDNYKEHIMADAKKVKELSRSSIERAKNEWLENFDKKHQGLVSAYFDGTIGYAFEELYKKRDKFLQYYSEVVEKLEERIQSSELAIDVENLSNYVVSKIQSDMDVARGLCDIPKFDGLLSCGCFSLRDSKTNRDYVLLVPEGAGEFINKKFTDEQILKQLQRKYYSLCLMGETGSKINPFTGLQFVSKENTLMTSSYEEYPKSVRDLMKEYIQMHVNSKIEDGCFARFVYDAKKLYQLWTAFDMSKEIFAQDLQAFLSKKNLRKQQKVLKKNDTDFVDACMKEQSESYKMYISDELNKVSEPFIKNADNIKYEEPFAEF